VHGTGANHGEFDADWKLPGRGRAAVHALGERLDLPGRILLLLHHAEYHRIRRLRAGNQPRRVGITGEAGSLCSLPAGRVGTDRDVFRPDAGTGEKSVS